MEPLTDSERAALIADGWSAYVHGARRHALSRPAVRHMVPGFHATTHNAAVFAAWYEGYDNAEADFALSQLDI